MSRADELRNRIREMVGEYYREAFPAREFIPGTSQVPVSGRVFDASVDVRSGEVLTLE